jgi:hypothetical protein
LKRAHEPKLSPAERRLQRTAAASLLPYAEPEEQETSTQGAKMADLARGCLAGYGASKLGGGLIGTIVVFIILYWLLGYVM